MYTCNQKQAFYYVIYQKCETKRMNQCWAQDGGVTSEEGSMTVLQLGVRIEGLVLLDNSNGKRGAS